LAGIPYQKVIIRPPDADLVVELGMPGRPGASVAAISRGQVGRLVEFLDQEVRTASDKFAFRGNLVGISLRTKFFRLEAPNAAIMLTAISTSIGRSRPLGQVGKINGKLTDMVSC
jgi:hypothetical protein